MELDVFLKGETIDLCIPTEEFAKSSKWYSWFNNPKTTRYLDYGIFPHSSSKQIDHFREAVNDTKKLLLIISQDHNYIGVISLSQISFVKRRAMISLVVGEKTRSMENEQILALESIARLTEHAFLKLGLSRIIAEQHYQLFPWQQKLELLGYKVEGIFKNGFVKGGEVADQVALSILYEDYLWLKKNRGKYWDGAKKMMERIKNLPESGFVNLLRNFYNNERDDYYTKVFNI